MRGFFLINSTVQILLTRLPGATLFALFFLGSLTETKQREKGYPCYSDSSSFLGATGGLKPETLNLTSLRVSGLGFRGLGV